MSAIDVQRIRKFDTASIVAPRAISNSRLVPLLAVIVGIAVGIVGTALFAVTYWLAAFIFGETSGLQEILSPTSELGERAWLADLLVQIPRDGGNHWPLVLIAAPLLGGLLMGLWRFVGKDKGSYGFGEVIDVFHNKRGKISLRATLDKFVGSVLTLGFGGSGGREGPIALIGSSLGSFLSERFHLTVRERRILLAAGVAAGVGGMFRAPLAGGLLAAEIMYSDSDFEPDVLIPSILASVTSYCVFCLSFGWGSLFGRVAEDYLFTNPFELVPLAALALVLVAVGYLLVRTNKVTGKLLGFLPTGLRPAVGMGLGGVLAYIGYLIHDGHVLGVIGDGYVMLHHLFSGTEGFAVPNMWWLLVIIAGIKMLTSSLTYSGGGGVGQFAPSMVIGGCISAAVGLFFVHVFGEAPFLPGNGDAKMVAGVYAIVGMAGLYAALAKAPVSSVIIVSELTGSYHLLLPSLFVCALCFILSRGYRLYSAQVPTRKDSQAHLGDFQVNVLQDISVADILDELKDYITVREDTSLEAILSLKPTRQAYFPVVDYAERLVGIFSLNDLQGILHDHEVWHLLAATDIARAKFIKVTPDMTLADVSYLFTDSHLDEFPVVNEKDHSELIGMISRRQLNNAYIRKTMYYDNVSMVERTKVGQSESQDWENA